MGELTKQSVGSRLRGLRRGRMLTQQELSDQAQVPLQTLKDIERGKTQNPRFSTLRRLAHALSVEPDQLRPYEDAG
jgi:transcriptional regulator with XRE-family HTH domain